LTDQQTNEIISIAKPTVTAGLTVLAFGGALGLVTVFTTALPRYDVILATVILFHAISMGVEIALFVIVSKKTNEIQIVNMFLHALTQQVSTHINVLFGLGSSAPFPLTIWD
jgi:hypothetical protein